MAAIQRKREGLPVLQPLPSKQDPKCNGCAGDRGCCGPLGVSEAKSHLVDALFSSAVAPETSAPVTLSKEHVPSSAPVSALTLAHMAAVPHVELHVPLTHSISMSLASFNARTDVFVPPAPALVTDLLSAEQSTRLGLAPSEPFGTYSGSSPTREFSPEQPVSDRLKTAKALLGESIPLVPSVAISAPFFAFTCGYVPDRLADAATSLPLAASIVSSLQQGESSSASYRRMVSPLQTVRTPAYRSPVAVTIPPNSPQISLLAKESVRTFSSINVRKSPCVTNLLFSQIRVARYASPFESSTGANSISSHFATLTQRKVRDSSPKTRGVKEKTLHQKPSLHKIQPRADLSFVPSRKRVLSPQRNASAQAIEKTLKRQKTARAQEAREQKSSRPAMQTPVGAQPVFVQKSFAVSSFPPFVRTYLMARIRRKKRISLVELEYLINSTKTKKQVRFIAALKAALLKLLSSYRH